MLFDGTKLEESQDLWYDDMVIGHYLHPNVDQFVWSRFSTAQKVLNERL
jgi:hypothetical protein